jgi:hypothetical protein
MSDEIGLADDASDRPVLFADDNKPDMRTGKSNGCIRGVAWVSGLTFRRDAIAASRSASAHISIEPAIWSSGSSTKLNTVAGSQRAMTSWRPTTSLSSSLRRSGYGCALMSPRPFYFGSYQGFMLVGKWMRIHLTGRSEVQSARHVHGDASGFRPIPHRAA